jgi:HD-GYP domain-containing protein (c-di-GMP phosphodiesterase class II)
MTKVQGAPETPDGMFVFSGNRYFRVPPRFLIADRVLTFPLSFHFVRNKNLILKYRPGHRPTALQIVNYVSKGLLYFACPENFYTAWLEYLKNENPHALQTYLEEVQSLAMTAADSMSLLKSATEPIANLNDEAIRIAEKALAREAVGNPALPLAEKKRILVKIGNRMAALLDAFNSPDPEKRKSAYLECRTMTDEIVDIAAQSLKNKTTYQDLLMLKDSDIEHSSSVSTISVIFAMMLGFVDNQSLADISLGGLMHDIGHCHVPLEVFKNTLC